MLPEKGEKENGWESTRDFLMNVSGSRDRFFARAETLSPCGQVGKKHTVYRG